MLQTFGYISAFLSIIAIIPYVIDILKNKTRPERASWFIWAVLGSIAFFSQMAKGANESLWLTGSQTLMVVLIFILSIKYGVGGFTKRDVRALIGAGIGLILWSITKEPLFALYISIFIELIGVFLTVLKAYKEPETETLITWLISGTSGIFGALAVGTLNLPLLSFPVYIILANYAVVVSILVGRSKQKML